MNGWISATIDVGISIFMSAALLVGLIEFLFVVWGLVLLGLAFAERAWNWFERAGNWLARKLGLM